MAGMTPGDAKQSVPTTAAAPAEASPRGWRVVLLGYPAVALILLGHWALAFWSVSDKSPTFDEPVHLLGGYTCNSLGDYRIDAEAGVLSGRLAVLGLAGRNVTFPPQDEMWKRGDQWRLAHEFFYWGQNDPRELMLRPRGVMALVSVAMGLLIYFWLRRLFGPVGGMFSLVLFAASPVVLGNGPLVAGDVTSAFCFLLAVGCFWWMIHRLSPWSVAVSGLSLGLLFLSKMSAPIILPMLLALLIVRLWKGPALEVAVAKFAPLTAPAPKIAALTAGVVLNAAIVWASIWAGYSMRYGAFVDSGGQFQEPKVMQAGGTVPSAARWLNHHALLPQAYLYGMVYTSEHSRTRPGFLNGEHYLDGRAAFFPYLFAVKTPLSILAAMVLAAMAWLAQRKARRPGKSPPPDPTGQSLWYRTAPLWVLLIGYGGLAMLSQINIGLRHFLPVYGPLFVLVGICGPYLAAKARLAAPGDSGAGGRRRGRMCPGRTGLPGLLQRLRRRARSGVHARRRQLAGLGPGPPAASPMAAPEPIAIRRDPRLPFLLRIGQSHVVRPDG